MRFVVCLVLLCCLASPGLAIRGLWVHPEKIIDRSAADNILDQADRCHIDNVYVLVFHKNGVWFRTPLRPMASDVTEGFDPLGYVIEAAHKRGIRVHAWFVNGEMGTTDAEKHPDWQAGDAEGIKSLWYDFTKPEVRRFQCDLMLSAVKQYPDLDGIHFDYIRFPNTSLGYGPSSAKAFADATGHKPDELPQWDSFPIRTPLSANPICDVTTGVVLAKFDNDLPAIVENRLGAGRVLFFNWQAEASKLAVLDAFLKARLKRMGADKRVVKVLVSERNDKVYGDSSRSKAEQWLMRAGVKSIQTRLSECTSGDICVIPCVYLWSDDEAARLRRLVEEGMNIVWIDGPSGSLPDLLAILGAKGSAEFFAGRTTITPVVVDPDMPVSKAPDYIARLEKQTETWNQWRKDCVTELVRSVYVQAKKLRPSIVVSAAVFYNKYSADNVLQDWQRWVRDGYVDYVVPMAYVSDTHLASAFEEWKRLPEWRKRVIPGLSIYTRVEGKSVPKPADAVRRQIELCAKNESDGQVLFCCHYISPEIENALK